MADIVVYGITIPWWVFVILIVIGLLMAFFGRAIWDIIMSMIGGIIGSIIGFVIGFILFGGFIIPLIFMFIFGFIGSILFKYLIRLALALLVGIIVAALVWLLMDTPPMADFAIIGLIVMIVVFIPCYYFIEQLVSILTAFIGGCILGVGIYGLTLSPWLGIGIGAVVWVVGSIIQLKALEKYDKVSERI